MRIGVQSGFEVRAGCDCIAVSKEEIRENPCKSVAKVFA
jgi:hypothetical protein